jgi:serine/threonine protein phosphatase PrpC
MNLEAGKETRGLFGHLVFTERSDTGRVRENNEDVALCLPDSGLFLVADGMGGAREGEVAARAVADHLRDAVSDPALSLPSRIRRCREAVNEASHWIRQYASRQGNPGMGTTAVILLFDPDNPGAAACLHAGDSRLYRFRDGILEQVTTDHSVAALAGVVSDSHVPAMFRSVITRAVGVRRNVELEVTSLDVRRGDLFLLCTDGLHGMMAREDMSGILASDKDLDTKAVSLIEAALAGGGDDNATAVLVRAGTPAQIVPKTGPDGEPVAPVIPEPARDSRTAHLNRGPLIGLLLVIALLGLAGIWFAFPPLRPTEPAAPERVEPATNPVPAVVPAPQVIPEKPAVIEPAPEIVPPQPPPPPPPPPVPPVPTNAPPVVAPEQAEALWKAEREDVAADPERLKERHAAVIAAFARLSAWTGKPLAPPSLMIAGQPDERPEAWFRYLSAAQAQWRAACEAETVRMRAESSCLSQPGLKALWRWVHPPGEKVTEGSLKELVAAWEDWGRELSQMERFLKDEPGTGPFLYALRPDLFTPGRNAADLGDKTWGPILGLVNQVWNRRGIWLDHAGEGGAVKVDEVIRQANSLWAGYGVAEFRIRPWRQTMKPDEAAPFFVALQDDVFSGPAKADPEDEN